jgi:putative nucleotidyltransferase with HDIG domain
LVSSGLWVMAAAAFCAFAVDILREATILGALQSGLWGLGNGLLSMVLTLVLLVVFETVFNLTTPLRLLELANPAQPLLRRLMQVAPGTYNHSIMMGNLAEAAAEAIDADPLLARVGAYYHDIGKITRPEYFIENQLHISNPHDKLSPSLSRLAIMAHVRDGEVLARQSGLPQPVVDIIRQHHGTSVLSYFYQKAKQNSSEEVLEEEYRYEEEKPATREAAIIMLADSVEAAAKSMRNPTLKKLQGLIHEIFKQKMEDGQLDRSQLTFGDLQKIGEVFDNGLRGMMGQRIEYPWQADRGRAERGVAREASVKGEERTETAEPAETSEEGNAP